MKSKRLLVVSALMALSLAGTLVSCNVNESSSQEASSSTSSKETSSIETQSSESQKSEVVKEYTITAENGNGYSITDLSKTKAKEGETVSFKVTLSDETKVIESVKANNDTLQANNDVYSFTMPKGDVIISVALKAKTYNIVANNADGYTIVDLSALEAKEGDHVSFKVNVTDEKKEISSVKANETECTLENDVYSFTMPRGDVTISVTLVAKKYKYEFEAEDAYFSGKEKIETTNRAHGDKSISTSDMNVGDTIVFKAIAKEEGKADLNIYLNTVDPFTFEEAYTLKINGVAKTVGTVKGSGWDGSQEGGYFDFRNPVVLKDIDLVAGLNTFEFTVVAKGDKKTNFDRIEIVSSVEVLADKQVFEAEDAFIPASHQIEETDKASGGKCVSGFDETDETMIYYVSSNMATEADLAFDICMNDAMKVSDYLEVRVNGSLTDFGTTKGYWKGTPYYEFGHLTRARVSLKEGVNKISFTVKDGSNTGNGRLNFDRIVFQNTMASLSWAKEETAKIDIVAPTSEGYTITDLSALEAKEGDPVSFRVSVTDETKLIDSVKIYGNEVASTDDVYSFTMGNKVARIQVSLKEKPVPHVINVPTSEDFEITDLSATSAVPGNEITFKVILKNTNKKIVSVKVGGALLTANAEGVYSFIMPGNDVSIVVELDDIAAKVANYFEAESAYFSGKEKIEKTARARSGRAISCSNMNNGDTITFKCMAENAGKADLKLFMNTVDAFTFESVFTLKINGTSKTVGEVKGSGWDGSQEGGYFDFRNPVLVSDVDLLEGLNTIELTLVDKGNKASNFDCLEIDTAIKLSSSYVFEAEDATLSSGVGVEETADASAGKCVKDFNTTDQTVTFHVTSDKATTADLGFDINMNDPMKVEEYMTITVNDVNVTYPDQTQSYWSGNVYHEFGHIQWSNINLIAGDNVIVFKVKDGSKCGNGKLNFDRIIIQNTLANLTKAA